MKKSVFMETYPICSIELQKDECRFQNVDGVLAFFKEKIDNHPKATFISLFDHFNHTKNINGEVEEGMKDAKNIIFCFGPAIPSSKPLAVRPRSFGVCEYEDRFHIDFLEAPNKPIQDILESWVLELKEIR
ncbi:MAG: hypothetical protein PWQ42_393 [Sulfurospirillum sp.]|jgi:hypothetical protein|nr:hypothetical protein [Sulfurospirillum sp.]DAB33333.1 MAG TPA: hypothetical protein CFH82_11110 [Sulfurospirillum sp. UBA12182]